MQLGECECSGTLPRNPISERSPILLDLVASTMRTPNGVLCVLGKRQILGERLLARQADEVILRHGMLSIRSAEERCDTPDRSADTRGKESDHFPLHSQQSPV